MIIMKKKTKNVNQYIQFCTHVKCVINGPVVLITNHVLFSHAQMKGNNVGLTFTKFALLLKI